MEHQDFEGYLVEQDEEDFFHDDHQVTPKPNKNKKKRIDDLLEEKRLRAEFGDYDDYYGKNKNCYGD